MLTSKLQEFSKLRELKKEKQKAAQELLLKNQLDYQNKIPTIIVCIDIANASSTVLKYACCKAKKSGFAVQVLAVVDNSHHNLLFASRTLARQKRAVLEKELNQLIKDIHKETGIIPSIAIKEGDLIKELIKEVENNSACNMLIFGNSKNSFVDNTILPKIFRQIGNKINVPVVIVPGNLTDQYLKELL